MSLDFHSTISIINIDNPTAVSFFTGCHDWTGSQCLAGSRQFTLLDSPVLSLSSRVYGYWLLKFDRSIEDVLLGFHTTWSLDAFFCVPFAPYLNADLISRVNWFDGIDYFTPIRRGGGGGASPELSFFLSPLHFLQEIVGGGCSVDNV